jgi:hypothetical protein
MSLPHVLGEIEAKKNTLEIHAIIKHAPQPTGRFPFARAQRQRTLQRPYATEGLAEKSTSKIRT